MEVEKAVPYLLQLHGKMPGDERGVDRGTCGEGSVNQGDRVPSGKQKGMGRCDP